MCGRGKEIEGVVLLVLLVGVARSCTVEDTQPLLTAMFESLGNDCKAWFSLFGEGALYYHQHDGFKTYDELMQNCENYAAFCPGGNSTCVFQQQTVHQVQAVNGECHILAPYLWSEIPADHLVPNNLEPHTGWEYIIAQPDPTSKVGYNMTWFAEIETSYAAKYHVGDPTDSSVYWWTLDLLEGTASQGECNSPVAPVLTDYFATNGGRQQADAVLLSVGGLCQVTVPYSKEEGGRLSSGFVYMVLQPSGDSYVLENPVVTFPYDFKPLL